MCRKALGLQQVLRNAVQFLQDSGGVALGSPVRHAFEDKRAAYGLDAALPLQGEQILEHDEAKGIRSVHVFVRLSTRFDKL